MDSDLYASYFDHVEAAILDNTPLSLKTVLEMYTSLLRRWIAQLLAQPKALHNQAEDPVGQLITHVDLLSLSMLDSTSAQPTISATSTILTFWEVVASATQHTATHPSIRISTPSALLVYHLFFTSSLSNLSRICAILSIYKRAFEGARNASNTKGGEAYPRDYVNHFNGYLMDICNCLWRNRAFNREDVNALGCLAPTSILPPLRVYADSMGYQLPAVFSLSYSNILCAVSIDFFRAVEDLNAEEIVTRHRGPVTQRSLTALGNEGGLTMTWADYRLGILNWLEDRGVYGIGELMYNTMKHLMVRRGRQSMTAAEGVSKDEDGPSGAQG
jgi:centromere protein I